MLKHSARPGQALALDRAVLATIKRRAAIAAILWAIALSLWSHHIVTWSTPRESIDTRMEAGCRWPALEGEMTVVAVRHGEVICWRFR